jgi:hypothetical protein
MVVRALTPPNVKVYNACFTSTFSMYLHGLVLQQGNNCTFTDVKYQIIREDCYAESTRKGFGWSNHDLFRSIITATARDWRKLYKISVMHWMRIPLNMSDTLQLGLTFLVKYYSFCSAKHHMCVCACMQMHVTKNHFILYSRSKTAHILLKCCIFEDIYKNYILVFFKKILYVKFLHCNSISLS